MKTYTVTYDANGGTGTVKDENEYHSGDKVTVMGDDGLSRRGYNFTGWNTEADGTGTAYAEGNTFEITKDTTLYAQWEAKEYSYTVKYYKDSELLDTVTSDVTYELGAQISKDVIEDKCPAGYALDTGKSTQMPYTITDGDNIIEVYYTKRSDLSYTVNYYWNGTTDKAAESKTVENQTFGEEVTVSPAEIEGYTPVFPKDQTITIVADNSENVINFNYYKNVTLTAKSDTKIYDGEEHTVEGYTGAPEGVTFDITASGTGIDAGTYDVTFSDGTVGKTDTTAKYIVTDTVNGKLTISPIADKVTVTITGHKDTAIYDGTEKSVTGYDVASNNALYTADDFTFSGTAEAKGTDADTYQMGLTADMFKNTSKNFSNVKFEVKDGSLTINKCLVTITAENVTTVYDGKSPVVKDYTILREVSNGDPVNTLPTGHKIDSYVTYSSGVDAGVYDWFSMKDATILDAKDKDVTSNYDIDYGCGTLTIKPREITLTSEGGSKVYDGTPLTKPEVKVTGSFVDGEVTDIKATGTITDVGTVTNTIEYTATDKFKTDNYDITKNEGKLEVTKREVTLTSASDSKVYDGTALTNGTVNVGGKGFAKGEGATYNVTGTITNVGEVNNTFTYTLNKGTKAENYEITEELGTLKVTPITDKVTVTIKGNTKTVYYNGKEQSVKGYTVSIDNNLYKEADFALKNDAKAEAKGTKVGTYPMGLTKESFENTNKNFTNVVFVVEDGYLKIKRHSVTPSRPSKPTVEIPDDDALGLNTTDHFAYIVGYGNGEVRPQNNITRAEVATIFFRLLTDDVRDENLTKTNRYSDVAATSWYNTAVSTLSSMGIITGYPDGTFRPNAAITRAEFAAIAARFDHDGDKTAAKFSDIATHWAKDEISIAYNNGWITGYPDGTFGPQRDITRAETMTLVNRVLNRQPETEDDLLPNMVTWTDNADKNAWYYLAVQEATNSHYYKFKTNSKYEKWTELRETRDWTLLEK